MTTINKEKYFKLYNMTYNEKKTLYESIMKDVAKIVKRQINEEEKLYYRPLDKNNLHKIGEFVNEIIGVR